jgi:acyl-CoA synthetase (AMP-forming)/AMP-acid ligase II
MWTGTAAGDWTRTDGPGGPDHPLLAGLRERGGSGLVLFSSGSTGTPKAILHETERFLRKFDAAGKPMRTLAFLLFDHVAGQDTLFYTLAAGGCLVLPTSRDPERIARLVESARVEVLPASPTFLKLFCLSGAHERHDLSSLRIVTYGSEAMPPATLARVNEVFAGARIVQKYGTSELGSPRSRSRDGGSLWMSLKDDEIQAKVVDGILWLRSDGAMLGYLNAPNPIDEAGWWCTGDLVEVDGDWIRILGRESELINVGGEKVYPREVEEAILELDWVADALVRGAPHPITGHIVEAVLNLVSPRDDREVRKAVRAHCRARLAPYQVPARVLVTDEPLATERHKKRRGATAG